MELLSRTDLTILELAEMLGRSYAACVVMRKKLRRGEPRAVYLAGTAA